MVVHSPVSTKDAARIRAEFEPNDFWLPPAARSLPEPQSASSSPEDFWTPSSLRHDTKSVDSADGRGSSPDDWWSNDPDVADEQSQPDWGVESTLPWFDSQLVTNPYQVFAPRRLTESIAERRGRWLSQLLSVPSSRSRRNYARHFAEIFELFSSQATFRALADLAVNGVDPDALIAGAQFRVEYLSTPSLGRRRSARVQTPYPSNEAAAQLSWRRAVRLAAVCGGDNPIHHINVDWHDAWLRLPLGHDLFWTYLDYVEWRLVAASLGYLEIKDPPLSRKPFDYAGATQSRTGEIVRGQRDHVGVLYAEPKTPNLRLRRSGGKASAYNQLLGD